MWEEYIFCHGFKALNLGGMASCFWVHYNPDHSDDDNKGQKFASRSTGAKTVKTEVTKDKIPTGTHWLSSSSMAQTKKVPVF